MALSLLLLAAVTANAAEPEKQPNVIVIVGDDMGYADVGFHGGKDIITPHLDALAKLGGEIQQRLCDRTVLFTDSRGPAHGLVNYDLAADGKAGISEVKLYNLKDDIGETTDVSTKHPDRVKALQAAWDVWNKSNVAPLWGGGKAQ